MFEVAIWLLKLRSLSIAYPNRYTSARLPLLRPSSVLLCVATRPETTEHRRYYQNIDEKCSEYFGYSRKTGFFPVLTTWTLWFQTIDFKRIIGIIGSGIRTTTSASQRLFTGASCVKKVRMFRRRVQNVGNLSRTDTPKMTKTSICRIVSGT